MLERGFYRHFKGGVYLVENVVVDEALERLVVLFRDKHGHQHERPLDEFNEHVNRDGYTGPRFTKLDPQTP